MSDPVVVVLVRVRPFVGVLFGHFLSSPFRETHCLAWL
jgi:hypothetical protein